MRTLFTLFGVAFLTAALLWPFLIRDFIYFTLLPEPLHYSSDLERLLRAAASWVVAGKGRMLGIQFSLGIMSFLCFYMANLLEEEDD